MSVERGSIYEVNIIEQNSFISQSDRLYNLAGIKN